MKIKCESCGRYMAFMGYEEVTSFTNDEQKLRSEYIAGAYYCMKCGISRFIRVEVV